MMEANNDEKFAKAIKDYIEEYGEYYQDFSGKNCDECPGWSIHERRCDCGNSRVDWATDEKHDGTINVWPEAW